MTESRRRGKTQVTSHVTGAGSEAQLPARGLAAKARRLRPGMAAAALPGPPPAGSRFPAGRKLVTVTGRGMPAVSRLPGLPADGHRPGPTRRHGPDLDSKSVQPSSL